MARMTDAEREFLIRTHGTMSVREQAQALGVTEQAIKTRRTRLARAGALPPLKAHAWRRWTAEDDEDLLSLIAQALGAPSIARKLRRTVNEVYNRIEKMGGMDAVRAAQGVRCLEDVARLLGVDADMVRRWVRRGWMLATPNRAVRGRVKKSELLIPRRSLLRFFVIRPSWPYWEPSSIADTDLRAYAQRIRDRAGGRWMTVAEVGDQLGWSPHTVQGWVRDGRIGATTGPHGGYYLWSEDVAQFTPPLDEPDLYTRASQVQRGQIPRFSPRHRREQVAPPLTDAQLAARREQRHRDIQRIAQKKRAA